MNKPEKRYLGDSVYVEFDGYQFKLTTDNGYFDDPRNIIILEPEVLLEFHKFYTGVILDES